MNIIGCLVIGFTASALLTESRLLSTPDTKNFLMIGILGGYTTFSAFSLQTLMLARDGYLISAGLNVFLSVVLCLIAVWLGYICASMVFR